MRREGGNDEEEGGNDEEGRIECWRGQEAVGVDEQDKQEKMKQ